VSLCDLRARSIDVTEMLMAVTMVGECIASFGLGASAAER